MEIALRCISSSAKTIDLDDRVLRVLYDTIVRRRLRLIPDIAQDGLTERICLIAEFVDHQDDYRKLLKEVVTIDFQHLEAAFSLDENVTFTHVTVFIMYMVDMLILNGVIGPTNYQDWFRVDRPMIRRFRGRLVPFRS